MKRNKSVSFFSRSDLLKTKLPNPGPRVIHIPTPPGSMTIVQDVVVTTNTVID